MGADYLCGLCGETLDVTAILAFEDDPGSGFCWECARTITNRFLEIRSSTSPETTRRSSNHDREILERLEALEDLTRRVKNVWVLWLNDASKGAINPGTFHTMKHLLGMDEA